MSTQRIKEFVQNETETTEELLQRLRQRERAWKRLIELPRGFMKFKPGMTKDELDEVLGIDKRGNLKPYTGERNLTGDSLSIAVEHAHRFGWDAVPQDTPAPLKEFSKGQTFSKNWEMEWVENEVMRQQSVRSLYDGTDSRPKSVEPLSPDLLLLAEQYESTRELSERLNVRHVLHFVVHYVNPYQVHTNSFGRAGNHWLTHTHFISYHSLIMPR